MKIVNYSALLFLGCTLLSGCGVTKKDLGLVKESPNEFMVMSRAPLSLPPEYDLRPVVEQNSQENLKEQSDKWAGLSDGERRFMRAIGAQQNYDGIREQITSEMRTLYE